MLDSKPSRVADVMTRAVITIGQDDLISTILSQMTQLRFRHMPVVDGEKRLVGLLTQRDLLHASSSSLAEAGEPDPAIEGVLVNRIMKTEVFSLKAHDTLAEAASLMLQSKVGCAPVVDDNHVLVGIITDTDFIRVATWFLAQG